MTQRVGQRRLRGLLLAFVLTGCSVPASATQTPSADKDIACDAVPIARALERDLGMGLDAARYGDDPARLGYAGALIGRSTQLGLFTVARPDLGGDLSAIRVTAERAGRFLRAPSPGWFPSPGDLATLDREVEALGQALEQLHEDLASAGLGSCWDMPTPS